MPLCLSVWVYDSTRVESPKKIQMLSICCKWNSVLQSDEIYFKAEDGWFKFQNVQKLRKEVLASILFSLSTDMVNNYKSYKTKK